MSLHNVTPGKKAPDEFNVIIEIPMNADPIKYEVDKESGAMFVDRFMTTAMHYPCNYGYIPQTLADDGDPVDVLVITPYALTPGVVVTCRPIGVLMMDDEAGGDAKLLAVPIDKILPIYTHWQKPDDINQMRLEGDPAFLRALQGSREGQMGQGAGLGRSRQGRARRSSPVSPPTRPARTAGSAGAGLPALRGCRPVRRPRRADCIELIAPGRGLPCIRPLSCVAYRPWPRSIFACIPLLPVARCLFGGCAGHRRQAAHGRFRPDPGSSMSPRSKASTNTGCPTACRCCWCRTTRSRRRRST